MPDASIVFDHVHLISEDPRSAASWYQDKLVSCLINCVPFFGNLTFDCDASFLRGSGSQRL
jgi:hypothetical protein